MDRKHDELGHNRERRREWSTSRLILLDIRRIVDRTRSGNICVLHYVVMKMLEIRLI